MARLVVRLHGDVIADLKLEADQEYIAGRAQDAQIRLGDQRGISRQHLKFYQREGAWICETLSKFVLLQKGGQSFEILELTESANFSLPPYDFAFEMDAAPAQEDLAVEDNAANQAPAQQPGSNLPVFYQPRVNVNPQGSQPMNDEHTNVRVNNEATVAGSAHLVPYFRISYPNTADDEVLKLEGQLWTAGRDHDCEILIDSPHVSRKHFEVARTKEGFFITDLGSSNGTKINGNRIPPHEPTRIESGDEIQVMNISMSFEIRDTMFSNRLENLPVAAFDPLLSAPVPGQWSPGPAHHLPAVYSPHALPAVDHDPVPGLKDWKKLRPHHLKKVNWKKNKVRVALMVLVPLLLVMALTEPPPKKPERDPAAEGGNSLSFEALSKERQSVVKDSFNLARNLYVQGKYALCLTELAKVHEIIPQFQDSKELQSFCEQGLLLVQRAEDAERRERERQQLEQQISGFVDQCKTKLTPESTVDDTRACLAEAMVLAPDHPLIVEMIHTAQMNEEERKARAKLAAEESARAEKGEAHFRKADALYKKGRLSAAIEEFERFLRTDYPRDDDEKQKARRQVASIKQELQVKVSTLLEQCKGLGAKSKWRDAYIACDKAVDEDPGNKAAKAQRDQMLTELRKEMKVIYEDSVLEESLGNVDSAKEKWRKIIQENLDFDDYTKKAKSKLGKYGG